MNSIQKTARIAGLLYLALAIIGPFSLLYVPEALIVAGDAAATTTNIKAAEGLFRLGIGGEVLIFLIEIVLSVLLYQLVKPVGKTLAMVALASRLAMAVVQGVNVLNKLFVLLLLSGAGYLTALEPGQLQALVATFLAGHAYGVYIWGAFFGLHLLALGYLVFRAGYLPGLLGVLLMIGAIIGELGLTLWLLIKGVNVEGWEKRVLDASRIEPAFSS